MASLVTGIQVRIARLDVLGVVIVEQHSEERAVLIRAMFRSG